MFAVTKQQKKNQFVCRYQTTTKKNQFVRRYRTQKHRSLSIREGKFRYYLFAVFRTTENQKLEPTVSIRIREEEIFHYLFAVNEQQYTTIETLVSIRKIKRKGILTGVVAGSDEP